MFSRGLPKRFSYLNLACDIYGQRFFSSAEVDRRADHHDPSFAVLAAAYNEGRRRGDRAALTSWIGRQRWPWQRKAAAKRLYWVLVTFSCKGCQGLGPFNTFEVCFVNPQSSLDALRIPEELAFLRDHIERWNFLADQNEAGAFKARATPGEKEELRRIAARFREPAIAAAYEAWMLEEGATSDERWWAGRLLSTADQMGLYG